ncbi:hypothetical protein V6Z11_D11G270200 [Gossypium hirsutum]
MSSLKVSAQMDYDLQHGHLTAFVYWVNERIHSRNFVEMPSSDWREVADNWFGGCCCSFGGISEKLVT